MRLFLTCKEASRLISERLDRPLGTREGVLLRVHVAFCDACTRLTRQFSLLRRAARNLAEGKNPR